MDISLFIMFISLLLMLILNVPIAIALGLSSSLFLFMHNVDLIMVAQRMFAAGDSFILTAIPLFILAGSIMSEGGVMKRIVNFGSSVIGHVQGSLAMVNVFASMVFAGISGSSLADTSGIGAMLIPAMEEKGYNPAFSAGITAVSSTVGNIIPPSINALIYASLASVSVGRLFLAAAIPGILIGLFQMLICYIVSVKRNYPVDRRASISMVFETFKDAFFALFMPIIIIMGIVGGIVTPTEAGVVAVVYGLFVTVFVYKELKISAIPQLLINTARTVACVMMILVTANIFAWCIAFAQVPKAIASILYDISSNPYVILMIVNIFLIIVGAFMDPGAGIIVFTPILLPIITRVGIDPVLFGIIIIVNLAIGVVTPPVGACLYAAAKIANTHTKDVFREVLPFLIANIFVLLLVTFFHEIVNFLPNLFMK